jgi:cardiolipin synthase
VPAAFARTRAQVSAFGRFLDPIADKLLVAAIILMLVAFDRIAGLVVLPALIILCREILVSGLREFLAGLNVGLPVSRLSKLKTLLQLVALGFLIVGDAGPAAISITLIGEVGLLVAALLTLVTGYDYLVTGLRHMARTHRRPTRAERLSPAGRAAPSRSDRRLTRLPAAAADPHRVTARAMKIFGLVGWSGSGKTSLVVRLLPELSRRGLSVSTMKHAHHDFDIDKPGKDSHAHRAAGAAEVMVASPAAGP